MNEKVDISLRYGNRDVNVELLKDNLLCVLSPKDSPPVSNEKEEITRSLNNPISSSTIQKLAHKCRNVVIVSDDYTRITPTWIILPCILNELNRAGISYDQIKIVVALGTHRPMTQEESIQKFGEDVAKRIRIENHDFRDIGSQVRVGSMSNGAPIFINKEVYEAQLKIGVGNIVPHHVCGWAGGAKIVLPGISGEETTACMHLFSAQNKKSFLGILENPVRKMMEETSKAINFNIVFNTVLDMQGKIIRTFFGDIVHAFRAGVSFARKIYSVEIPALADIVLVSSSPYDVDFWQAHKTLYSADLAVKDGGTIIVASPCYEGVSKVHPELLKIAHMEPRNIEAKLEAGEIEDKLAAAQSLVWGQIRGRANVILVTEGVSPEEARLMGFEHCCSIEEALELGFQKHGKKAKVTVLTRPDVIPQVF